MSNYNNLTIEEQQHQVMTDAELTDWNDLLRQLPEDHQEEAEKTLQQNLSKFKGVPDDQMKELLYKPLENKKDLRNWIKYFLGIDLPNTTVDPDSNCNPLEMVWLLYETAVPIYRNLVRHIRLEGRSRTCVQIDHESLL